MRLDLKLRCPSEEKTFCVEAKYGQLGGKDCAPQVEPALPVGSKRLQIKDKANLIEDISKPQNPRRTE